jgi:hypothetical protein
MMRFFRRVFGGHGPSIYSDEPDSAEYDSDTQNMILSSIDLLELILAKGEELESERVINHFFNGENTDVIRAARFFDDLGYFISDKQHEKLHIVERDVLSVGWIEQTIPLMCRRAGEFDLDYDGWDIGQALGPRDTLFINS